MHFSDIHKYFFHVKASLFCRGSPVFSLAEPSDFIIICGEFNSGVEILRESSEPEQLFTVTKIIQHPDYKPTTVRRKFMVKPDSSCPKPYPSATKSLNEGVGPRGEHYGHMGHLTHQGQ